MPKQAADRADAKAVVTIDGHEFVLGLIPKTFKSGNVGFWNQMRFSAGDGRSFNIQITVVAK